MLGNDEITALVTEAAHKNIKKKISGLLLLSGSKFLQVLEGPDKAVNALFQKIINDDRHHGVQLVHYEQVASRYFQEWSMRILDLNDLPMAQRKLLMDKYADVDGFVVIPSELPTVFALLLDARAICLAEQPGAESKGKEVQAAG